MDFQHILDDLFLQLNQIRLHPRETANTMSQILPTFNNSRVRNNIQTRQGPAALQNLVTELQQRTPIKQTLKWSFALHMAADDQANILGEQGLYTTQGTPFHKPLPQRVAPLCIIKGRVSQTYEFGGASANDILAQLLIDDGLTSRKRRHTLLDPIYKYVGIGVSYHQKYQACTVIILAQDVVGLVAPDSSGRYRKRRVEKGAVQTIKNIQNHQIGGELVNYSNNNDGNGNGGSFILSEPRQPSIQNITAPPTQTVTYTNSNNDNNIGRQSGYSPFRDTTTTPNTTNNNNRLTQSQQVQYQLYKNSNDTHTNQRIQEVHEHDDNDNDNEPRKLEKQKQKSKCNIM